MQTQSPRASSRYHRPGRAQPLSGYWRRGGTYCLDCCDQLVPPVGVMGEGGKGRGRGGVEGKEGMEGEGEEREEGKCGRENHEDSTVHHPAPVYTLLQCAHDGHTFHLR